MLADTLDKGKKAAEPPVDFTNALGKQQPAWAIAKKNRLWAENHTSHPKAARFLAATSAAEGDPDEKETSAAEVEHASLTFYGLTAAAGRGSGGSRSRRAPGQPSSPPRNPTDQSLET